MDNLSVHEALHTAHICTSMVDDFLASHPAVEANPEWKAKADEAVSALADLYQMIGAAR